jgi:hypothetical protein
VIGDVELDVVRVAAVPIARRRYRPWRRGGDAQARGVGMSGAIEVGDTFEVLSPSRC